MMPDLENAALKAAETLIRHRVTSAPVVPMPVLKAFPGAVVVSFAELGQSIGLDRSHVLGSLVTEAHDAITVFNEISGKPSYIVEYNKRLPFYMLQRALSRELGHIVLGHDGTRPDDVRNAEAYCFAHHLLCPRPLIHALRAAGIHITVEVLGSVTGCYERCLAGIRREPGVRVPPELNRAVRDQFAAYLDNYIAFQRFLSPDDMSPVADFGNYMDNYEE